MKAIIWYARCLICKSANLVWKIVIQNVGCVFAYFCGWHKNNFPYVFVAPLICWLFQLYAIRHFVTSKLGKKYKSPTILSFLLTIGHENFVFPIGYVGHNIMVKTVLKQRGLNCKKRKCHVNLDSITFQRKLHNNFKWKINLHLPWKYLKLSEHQLSSLKK